jgi:hypothetical protein
MNYCEEKGISTSKLNEAQRTLYFIAENMKMTKSISEEGYEHFQQAIKALEQESTTEEEYEYIYIGNGAYEKRPKVKSELTTKNDLGVDCISRQAVLDLINADWKYENLEIEINNLPSVTPQEPRWIPVSERLPTKEEYIANNGLFIVTDGNRTYAEYFDVYNSMKYFGEPTMNGFRVDRCVIAWMPLPKPYEPQESEDKE